MNNSHVQTSIAIAVATSVVVAVSTYLYFQRKRKQNEVPTQWQQVAKVSLLNLYPLKSGRRVEINEGNCTSLGIQQTAEEEKLMQLRDRSFVAYDEENHEKKTARTYPHMVLIEVSVDDKDQVAFDAPGMDTLYVKLPKTTDKHAKETKIVLHMGEIIWSLDCGNAAAEWLSMYILKKPKGIRLGYHDGQSSHGRNIKDTHKKYINVFPKLSNKSTGMYSDLTSYHIVNQASVDELNSRLTAEPVSVYNFRPPIVIEGSGAPAYSEDSWDWVRIGEEAIFRAVQPCTRCLMTTVNQETGLRLADREPLKTMEGYRRLPTQKQRDVDAGPVMGMHLELIKPGLIKVGDAVYHNK